MSRWGLAAVCIASASRPVAEAASSERREISADRVIASRALLSSSHTAKFARTSQCTAGRPAVCRAARSSLLVCPHTLPTGLSCGVRARQRSCPASGQRQRHPRHVVAVSGARPRSVVRRRTLSVRQRQRAWHHGAVWQNHLFGATKLTQTLALGPLDLNRDGSTVRLHRATFSLSSPLLGGGEECGILLLILLVGGGTCLLLPSFFFQKTASREEKKTRTIA